jgi:zinc transport system substrate-binding protein
VAIEASGSSPSVSVLQRLISEARTKGIRVVFVQPQESQRQAALVADAIGGRLVEVDPMSMDLEGNLLRISRVLEDSFQDTGQ